MFTKTTSFFYKILSTNWRIYNVTKEYFVATPKFYVYLYTSRFDAQDCEAEDSEGEEVNGNEEESEEEGE